MELINKLSQYKLVSLCAAWGCKYVWNRLVDWSFLLVLHALQVAVKSSVAR